MNQSKFCRMCGVRLEDGERFCGECGIDTESSEHLSNVSAELFQPAETQDPIIEAQINKPSSDSSKTAVVILSIVLGAIILVGGGSFLWFVQSSRLNNNPSITESNQTTTGTTEEKQVVIDLPTYSLNEGSYTASQKVEINKPTGTDIQVYFTTDGTDPTAKSSHYESAIAINATTTLKSIAIDKNGNKSGIKTGIYTITVPQQATTQQPTTTPATTPTTTSPETNEWQQFENNISGTWMLTDASGFTLYYQFSNGMLRVTDGGSDYYYDTYRSTVSTGTNGSIGTIYTGSKQLTIDCNPMGDNAIYIDGYYCTYVP